MCFYIFIVIFLKKILAESHLDGHIKAMLKLRVCPIGNNV